MTQHSTLSASSSHRWLACPGSVAAVRGMPHRDTVYAAEGTAAHLLAARCLTTSKNSREFIGSVIPVGSNEFRVTEEMADAVQMYLDVIREDIAKAGPGADLYIEHRFNLDHLYPGMYGTNDALLAQQFGVLRVYDYKHGAGVSVDVIDNPQLMYYALGAIKDGIYEDVELVIVQPRADHPDGPVRRQMLSVGELTRWADEVLVPGAEAASDPNAPLRTGEHCRFCDALAVCPAQQEQALTVARQVFEAQPKPLPPPEALPEITLHRVLMVSNQVTAWLASVRDYARGLLESGEAAPEDIGFKLVNGRLTRSWADEDSAAAAIEAAGIDPFNHKLKSPAAIEKELTGSPAFGSISQLIKSERGVQMVPLSDKRAAVNPLTRVFGIVPEDNDAQEN